MVICYLPPFRGTRNNHWPHQHHQVTTNEHESPVPASSIRDQNWTPKWRSLIFQPWKGHLKHPNLVTGKNLVYIKYFTSLQSSTCPIKIKPLMPLKQAEDSFQTTSCDPFVTSKLAWSLLRFQLPQVSMQNKLIFAICFGSASWSCFCSYCFWKRNPCKD